MSQDYKAIQAKMGDSTEIGIEKLTPSEFNTRHAFIDRDHVEYLAGRIKERGFHPKRAISVNVVKDAKGESIAYRVVAGIHRFEAAKKAGLKKVPCLLYCGLTEEEECLLDKWDNEMDEDHKAIHFLEEAEHYKYLRDAKGWSQRQISKNKGIARGLVQWRLQIADLPGEVKVAIRGGGEGGHTVATHFVEGHFRDICRLKTREAQLAICQEITARGIRADRGEKDEQGEPIVPMKQKEVEERVRELLALEASGGEIKPGEMPAMPGKKEGAKVEEEAQEMMDDFGVEREEETIKGVAFDLEPRWMKHAPIARAMSFAHWAILRTLISFDMRYWPKRGQKRKTDLFYIAGNGDPREAYAMLANAIGIKSGESIEKRHLKTLERRGYIEILKAQAPGYPKFRIKWDKLWDFYRQYAWEIPFREGGLKNVPKDFTGVIVPTPRHEIHITKGQIKSGIDYGVRDTLDRLVKEVKDMTPKGAWKILNEHELGLIRKTLDGMPIFRVKAVKRGRPIENEVGFFLAALKGKGGEGWEAV